VISSNSRPSLHTTTTAFSSLMNKEVEIKANIELCEKKILTLEKYMQSLRDSECVLNMNIVKLEETQIELQKTCSRLEQEIAKPKKKKSGLFSAAKKGQNLYIDAKNINYKELLESQTGGASVYTCDVDGWTCLCKEVDLNYADNGSIEEIKKEITIFEALPYHKNIARYLFHDGNAAKLRIFFFYTKYSSTLDACLKQKKKILLKNANHLCIR